MAASLPTFSHNKAFYFVLRHKLFLKAKPGTWLVSQVCLFPSAVQCSLC